jgi:hypothetical protein
MIQAVRRFLSPLRRAHGLYTLLPCSRSHIFK